MALLAGFAISFQVASPTPFALSVGWWAALALALPTSAEPPSGDAPPPASEGLRVGLPIAIAVLAFLAFTPALGGEFVNFDDQENFTNNPHYRGIGPTQLAWMFSHFDGHYQPVTWLSHGFDFLLWKMEPRGYHLVNLLFHAGASVLVYLLLLDLLPRTRALEKKRGSDLLRSAAAIGALFFAVHPLRVESVAWISERKDVLYLFFTLSSLLFYLRAHPPTGARVRGAIAASLVCFTLSMLSKAMAMTLPVLLLLLDAYPLRRLTSARDLLPLLREKTLYFVVMAVGIGAELLAESKSNAIDTAANYTLADSISQPAYRLCFYLWKIVIPTDLQPMYTLPTERDPMAAAFVLAGAGAILVTVALLWWARRAPALLTGWLAFGLLLSPVLGLIQVGYHFASDRNSYAAAIVPAAMLAGGLALLWQRGRLVLLSAGVSVLLIAWLGFLSYEQSKIWVTSKALWTHTVGVDPGNYIGHYNLGHELTLQGDVEAAIDHYTRAINLKSDESKFWFNRALGWNTANQPMRALLDFDMVIQLDPEHWMALGNRGSLKLGAGDLRGAADDFTRAIEIQPERAGLYERRAQARERLGDETGANADRARSAELRGAG
ncbi:MAG: hypothetical protein VX466_03530 [Myxococcota bacterium]|nr:hypothetical protein [Myxococcota bacterium]